MELQRKSVALYWNGQLVCIPALGLYLCVCVCGDVHVTSNVKLRNYVRLLLNVELRNYVMSRQIVIEHRVT